MTRKDYVLLAKHIRMMLDANARLSASVAVAAALAEDNPRFDANRFFVACGVTPAVAVR